MTAIVGIRSEDKNKWERRVPLTPDHVAELVSEHRIPFVVQPSARRVFHDLDYTHAGARLSLDLGDCDVILGVKEIPAAKLLPGKAYAYFSHVIKGQEYNMPMLRRLLELGCTLIDYERIVDRRGRRIIFFGRHAGYAGMIDSLWALGRRLAHEGFITPTEEIRLAHQYGSLDEATSHIARVGDRIRHEGLPVGLRPIVFAFTGSGNVSQGAQEVFDRLPFQVIDPEELLHIEEDRDRPRNLLFKTVLEKEHRYARVEGGGFDAAEYLDHPERYRSALGPLLPHITVFMNGIYWEPGQPKLITREDLAELWRNDPQPKLRVIGDVTCDIDGSIEATVQATMPGDPVYVYDAETGDIRYGVEGRGTVVMAVDNLPCELPVEASQHFGDSLIRFIPPMARCDWKQPLDQLALPREIRDAIIVHRGELTPSYRYLDQFVKEVV